MPAHDMTATIHCAGCQHAYIATALFCPNCGRPRVREVPADPLLGKLLGERFLVQELLGQGGSGTIYRAEHVTLRRKVAIKVLHTELSRDDLAVERFRREATTVAEIDNEHIVEIHDFGRTPDGRLYLAMELLEGETLDTVLARDKQLSVERTADILSQVGEALMEAHAIGYVHRDLRPRNIYLAVRRGKANFVKLLDFGLAKLVETEGQAASTSLGMTFGDPRYMSPEQARGDRIDRRADIYQLGCVAYEMLTGAPPFAGNRVFDILTKQVTEIPQPLPTRRPGVPLWMEAAVTKMLAKDPENRFATTTRMVEALRRGLETGEVMEDDVARRRESIPPPSVSRVMQRMGMTTPVDEPLFPPAAPAAPPPAANVPAAVAPTVPTPAVPPGAPTLRTGIPPVEPGATMKAPIAPPPGKPDSVELLRRRTGTPRIGVPILDPAIVVPTQARVALPVQPPVAGVIDPVVAAPPPSSVPPGASGGPGGGTSVSTAAGTTAGAAPGGIFGGTASSAGGSAGRAPAAPDRAAHAASQAASAAPVGAAPGRGPDRSPDRSDDARVAAPALLDDAQPRGKKRGASAELNISQLWYDEGDQLSDDPASRSARARRTISPSTTDLSYYDEPPRRRWGLIAGIGAFAIIGGVVAIALIRGSSNEPTPPVAQRTPPSAAAAVEAAPSKILPSEPPAPDVAPTAGAAVPADRKAAPDTARPAAPSGEARSAAQAPAPMATRPASRRPEAHATVETRAPASPRRSETSFPVPGSEPTRRRPGGDTASPVSPDLRPAKGRAVPSITEGPRDPYGGDDAPADGAAPEKRAEFFANLGGQQLIGGDTVGAAASFKKALELDARNVAATIGMGEIALRQGLFGDAIAHLSKATKLAPKNSRALTLLGEAYLHSGNSAQAAAQFKKALQIDPDNARARDGYNEASSRVPPADDETP
ncbi:MAG: tetratricopeptide repeat protein [Deltaproteobacteria bacterium]|nr:MAG: tetratricopeptide repeat protein [Deltaproteobacteria bacterium]